MSERLRKRSASDGPLGREKPRRAVLFPGDICPAARVDRARRPNNRMKLEAGDALPWGCRPPLARRIVSVH